MTSALRCFLIEQQQKMFRFTWNKNLLGSHWLSPTQKERTGKKKKTQAQKQRREGSNPLIWSPTAVNSTSPKHPLTHSPTQKKNEQKKRKKHKNREERARIHSSGVLYCCKRYISTAVQYMWYCCVHYYHC